jgi:hypothetical protein
MFSCIAALRAPAHGHARFPAALVIAATRDPTRFNPH